jgi:hypothetical protein
MPSASRPGAHFRVEFDDATFAEDLEHTSSDTGQALAQRARDRLTAEGLPPSARWSSRRPGRARSGRAFDRRSHSMAHTRASSWSRRLS